MLAQAHADETYRQQLFAHPEQTLRDAGIEVPKGTKIVFHEFDPTERHIFLPHAIFNLITFP